MPSPVVKVSPVAPDSVSVPLVADSVTRVIASEPCYAPGALSRASYDPLSAEALSNEAQVV